MKPMFYLLVPALLGWAAIGSAQMPLPSQVASVPVRVLPLSVPTLETALSGVSPAQSILFGVAGRDVRGAVDAIGSVAESFLPFDGLLPTATPPLLASAQALTEDSLERLNASACQVVSAGSVRFDFGQLPQQGLAVARAWLSVVCPAGHPFRLLPAFDSLPRASLPGLLQPSAGGAPAELAVILQDDQGVPLRDRIFTGSGSVQSVDVFAMFQVPETAPRPSTLALAAGSEIQVMFE